MNKYDFGQEILPGSTIEWAYNKIESNSTILELGPSNGNLVHHLSQEKKCVADIVELDAEAGHEAANWCRNACLGIEEGNLEEEKWFLKLDGNQYDYIVILDVLEHIRNPLEVLQKVRSLLKPEGKLLLSIPNIAHNSVLLGLLKNKFQYTQVGLLDNTHVHFFTYDSIKQMLGQAGLTTSIEEVIQKEVGNNEIENYYGELPKNVEAYLKTRNLGTAYQFLFIIQKDNLQRNVELQYQEDKPYEVVAFECEDGTILAESKVNPSHGVIDFEINLEDNYNITQLRIDPLNCNCVISDISLGGVGESGEKISIPLKEYTGFQLDNYYLFCDDDPQLYFDIEEEFKKIFFTCKCEIFDDAVLPFLAQLKDILKVQLVELEESNRYLKKEADEYNEIIARLQEEKAVDSQKISSLQEKNVFDQKRIAELQQIQEANEENIVDLQNTKLQNEEVICNLQNIIAQNENKIIQQKNELDSIHDKIWRKIDYKFRDILHHIKK